MVWFGASPFNDLADLCPKIITPLLYAGLLDVAFLLDLIFIFVLLITALRRAVIDLVTPTIARMPHHFATLLEPAGWRET